MNKDNNRLEIMVFGFLITILSVSLMAVAYTDMKSNKATQAKLDALASETDAIHSRIDAIEEQTEKHNAENGEIVNTLIQNINDVKTNLDDEVKKLNDEIKRVEESKKKKKEEQQAQAVAYTASVSYDGGSGYNHPFRSQGTTNDGNYDYTWYSQRVLPGGGLNIPGRHVDEDGFVRDENGNLCIAARDLDKGTEVNTPFGKAVVYDYCPNGNLDIYTDW